MQEENLSTERESSCDITRRLVNRKRIVDWRHWQRAGAVVSVEGLELAPSRLLEEVGQGVATILYIPIHRFSDDGCLLTVKNDTALHLFFDRFFDVEGSVGPLGVCGLDS